MTAAAALAAPPDAVPLDRRNLACGAGLFADFSPWCGIAPAGQVRNFLGVVRPRGVGVDPSAPARAVTTELPTLRWGEGYYEWVTIHRAASAAIDRFTAVSLGAHFGGPLVNAAKLLGRLRPGVPFKLVAVEGDPSMCALAAAHFRDNGIDPADHAIVNAVIAADNRPVPFTVSAVRTGSNVAFHGRAERQYIADLVVRNKLEAAVATGLLLDGTTGLTTRLPGTEIGCEIAMASAVTVADVLGPLGVVDYLEIDIQSSEAVALPPAMALLDRKVRWIHLGTHGGDGHVAMRGLFRDHSWAIEADLLPETTYAIPGGSFRTQDGVLSLCNRRLG
jgi:hypothetical protein